MRLSKLYIALTTLALIPTAQADVVFHEDFSNGLGDFTAVSVKNDAPHDWQHISADGLVSLDGHGFDFGTATAESDDWLISPKLDVSETESASVSFTSRLQYKGQNLKAYVSVDFNGDPETATWVELTIPNLPEDQGFDGVFSEWTDSGQIDLSDYQGQSIHFAIRYLSTAEQVADADNNVGQWEINDVTVNGAEISLPTFSESFAEGFGEISVYNVKNDAPHDWLHIADAQTVSLDGHGFDFGTATAETDDWLVTPTLTIVESSSANFSFFSRLQYKGRNLKAYISSDFDGDPETATWTELTIPTLPEDQGFDGVFSDWTHSGAISLADYQGKDVNLAIRYLSTAEQVADADNNVGQWEVDDITVKGAVPSFPTFTEDFTSGLGLFETVSLKNDAPHNWEHITDSGIVSLDGHGFDFGTATEESDDWLITPELTLEDSDAVSLSFNSRIQYKGRNLKAYISTDYDNDVAAATWTELTIPNLPEDQGFDGVFSDWTASGEISLAEFKGENVFVALRYLSTAEQVADADFNVAQWEVDDISIKGAEVFIDPGPQDSKTKASFSVEAPAEGSVVGAVLTFSGTADSNLLDSSAYTWFWDFGNGDTANGQTVTYAYDTAGTYTPTLTVTFAGDDLVLPVDLVVEGSALVVPEPYVDMPDDESENDDSEDDDILGLSFSWSLLVLGLLGLRRRFK